MKRFFLVCAMFLLCALLVFAPEIFTRVSAPYAVSVSRRVLLRVALCTEDASSASSFYSTLAAFLREHPSDHLRIVRVSCAQMSALSSPPDVYLFPIGLQDTLSPDALFLPISSIVSSTDASEGSAGVWENVRYAYPFSPIEGVTLLCAISAQSCEVEAALALVSYLYDHSI